MFLMPWSSLSRESTVARDFGHSVMTFLPSLNRLQNVSSSSTPCGSLKEKPVMAIGSMARERQTLAWQAK